MIQLGYTSFASAEVSYLPRMPAPFFISLLSIEILTVGSFFVPVLLLCFVQSQNFARNKTTIERFARQQILTEEDIQNRVVNSGIDEDQRIILDGLTLRSESATNLLGSKSATDFEFDVETAVKYQDIVDSFRLKSALG